MADQTEVALHVTTDCPSRCGGEQVLRRSKHGTLFFGCTNYPQCTTTLAYDELVDTLADLIRHLTEKVLVLERRASFRVVNGGDDDTAA